MKLSKQRKRTNHLCASMYARSSAFIRDWYPAPCFLNHAITSESIRSDRSAFFGTVFKPLRATARANISGVHSGASLLRTMSASIIFRTRESLVEDLREVLVRFMFRGLAHGNEVNVVTVRSMRDRHVEAQAQEIPVLHMPLQRAHVALR